MTEYLGKNFEYFKRKQVIREELNKIKYQRPLLKNKYFSKFKQISEDNSRGAIAKDLMSIEDILNIDSSIVESIIFKLEPLTNKDEVAKDGIAETQKMDDQMKD